MSESTRLGRARGRLLPVSIVAAALIAMLVIVPIASAATPNPISSGSTTITLKSSVVKGLKKAGVKITAVKPAKIKGSKATLPVTGGEIEAASGKGNITHGGGLKIKAGKKSTTIKSVAVNSKTNSVSAKVGGKTVKLATLAGVSTTRLGFGNNVVAKKLKLTSAGAKALNKALVPKGGKAAFKANTVLGGSTTQAEPETDNVLASGSMTYTGDATLLSKLANVETKVELIPPTTLTPPTTFLSPISGGTVSPAGTSGTINSTGGIRLSQVLPTSATTALTTKITLGNFGVDLAAKTASVEVIGESNAESGGKKPLNLGNLGRSSIADLTIASTASPATRTVSISSTATIQPVAAEVLEGFVSVYRAYYAEAYKAEFLKAYVEGGGTLPNPTIEEAAKKKGEEESAKKTAGDDIKAGEALGSFSFIAQGE
jgi:hypothetical protein